MKLLPISLALMACPAMADPVNLTNHGFGGDTAALAMEGAVSGVVTYENHAAQHSTTGDWPLPSEYVTCRIHIIVTGGDEIARVECPEGWAVDPPHAAVPDGESAHFSVTMLGM